METVRYSVWCRRVDFGRELDLMITRQLPEGKTQFSVLGEWRDMPDDPNASLIAVQLPSLLGQSLVDGLWDEGYRPGKAEAGEREAAAVKAHLGDMRRLVAKALDVQLNME